MTGIKKHFLFLSLCLCVSAATLPARADAPAAGLEKVSADMATAAKAFSGFVVASAACDGRV